MRLSLAAAAVLLGAAAWAQDDSFVQVQPPELNWTEASAPFPAGVRIAVLEGDPKKLGFFTARFKLPPKTEIFPHTHPKDERVTVISGSVSVGIGEEFDRTRAKKLGPGSFYINPAKLPHYIFTEEGAILQVSAIGPWDMRPVKEKKRR